MSSNKQMTARLFIFFILLGVSCNCDEHYNKDPKIIARLEEYQEAYKLVSENYDFLKAKGLSFKSGSPGLEGLAIDFDKINTLTKNESNRILSSVKALWDQGTLDRSGAISFWITDGSPSIDFYVKRCRRIEHVVYFGENDMYDDRGQSDDFSIFSRDSLEGHWRYVIQQVNTR